MINLQEEYNCKGEHKTSNCKVYPLHVFQCLGIIRGFQEEDVRSQNRSNDRPDSIESLRKVDTQFSVFRRSTDYINPLAISYS